MKWTKVGVVVIVAGVAAVADLQAQKAPPKLNAVELAQLPKYCYAEYVDPNLKGNPQYSIQGCGVWMNHYCKGYVGLIRAQNVTDTSKNRKTNLHIANRGISYTLNHMPDGCWLRKDADIAMRQVKLLEPLIR